MPRFDKTGPQGTGPMTGGARGYCAIPVGSGFFGRGQRGLFGRTFGLFGSGGRGMRMGPGSRGGYRRYQVLEAAEYDSPMTTDQQLIVLRTQAEGAQQELDQIHRQINELEQE
ncbi:DUF5320 domain-containing protein [Candidatus Bipolaricaulota bacterium]